MGRSDRQIKIRGHRIELGEIEEAINNNPQIQNAVVIVNDGITNTSSSETQQDDEWLIEQLLNLDPLQVKNLLNI